MKGRRNMYEEREMDEEEISVRMKQILQVKNKSNVVLKGKKTGRISQGIGTFENKIGVRKATEIKGKNQEYRERNITCDRDAETVYLSTRYLPTLELRNDNICVSGSLHDLAVHSLPV